MISAALLLLVQGTQVLTRPVEVPFKLADDAIVVDAVLNGKKASFMFDTGFSGAFVLNDALNIGKPTGVMTLRDFVGEFQASTVKLKSLTMGAMTLDASELEVVQQSLEHLSESYNTHTDGIMGLEPLRHHVTEISFEKSKFIFHPRSVDISKWVPDNKKTFLVKMLPIGRNSIKIPAETKDGKKIAMALDTGNAYFAATHRDVLEEAGIWEKGKKPDFMRQSWIASGPTDSFLTMLTDLRIYGVPVSQSVWSVIDLPSSSSESGGTIGIGFLRNFNITFDLDRRRVWLENFTGKSGNEPVADIGISPSFDPNTKRVRVARVTPGSPAERAGIKYGDQILAVDGSEIGDRGFRHLSKMLEGPMGSKVQVAVSRDGNLTRYDLTRELLINGLPKETAK